MISSLPAFSVRVFGVAALNCVFRGVVSFLNYCLGSDRNIHGPDPEPMIEMAPLPESAIRPQPASFPFLSNTSLSAYLDVDLSDLNIDKIVTSLPAAFDQNDSYSRHSRPVVGLLDQKTTHFKPSNSNSFRPKIVTVIASSLAAFNNGVPGKQHSVSLPASRIVNVDASLPTTFTNDISGKRAFNSQFRAAKTIVASSPFRSHDDVPCNKQQLQSYRPNKLKVFIQDQLQQIRSKPSRSRTWSEVVHGRRVATQSDHMQYRARTWADVAKAAPTSKISLTAARS